jgi:hypothetical protein
VNDILTKRFHHALPIRRHRLLWANYAVGRGNSCIGAATPDALGLFLSPADGSDAVRDVRTTGIQSRTEGY